jgi:hypothetical protein
MGENRLREKPHIAAFKGFHFFQKLRGKYLQNALRLAGNLVVSGLNLALNHVVEIRAF